MSHRSCEWFSAALKQWLKFDHPSESLGLLVKTLDCWPHSQTFWFSSLGVGLRTCISNNFPGEADVADPEAHWESLPYNQCGIGIPWPVSRNLFYELWGIFLPIRLSPLSPVLCIYIYARDSKGGTQIDDNSFPNGKLNEWKIGSIWTHEGTRERCSIKEKKMQRKSGGTLTSSTEFQRSHLAFWFPPHES